MLKRICKLLCPVLFIVCFCIACGGEGLLLETVAKEEEAFAFTSEEDEQGAAADPESEMSHNIMVHVCGAVVSPGVYELSGACRVYDAVELAGGFDEDADTEAVNLVNALTDGEQIRIPYIGEANAPEEDGLIDINHADASKLCEIPGIGESRAEAIIAYRRENGNFDTVEELMQVPGIKEGLYARICPYVECK